MSEQPYAQNPSQTFPRNFPVEVASLLATSRNGIWETTRYNRHNGLLPDARANLLQACYRETGAMDCGLCKILNKFMTRSRSQVKQLCLSMTTIFSIFCGYFSETLDRIYRIYTHNIQSLVAVISKCMTLNDHE